MGSPSRVELPEDTDGGHLLVWIASRSTHLTVHTAHCQLRPWEIAYARCAGCGGGQVRGAACTVGT